MKDSLTILFRKLQALRAFEEKYQTEGHTICAHDLRSDKKPPLVTLYPEHDRDWILSTFGAEGWKTAGREGGFQHVAKEIEGVRVELFRAYQIPVEKPTNTQAVPPYMLTGNEASIEPTNA